MLRIALALCIAAVLATPAQAYLSDTHQLFPPEPVEGQSVSLSTTGYMPDGCWSIDYDVDCAIDGFDITVTFHTVDNWQPGQACVTIVLPLEAFCTFDNLARGTYHVTVIEDRTSPRNPSDDVYEFDFVVLKGVAEEQSNWSTLKARFRE